MKISKLTSLLAALPGVGSPALTLAAEGSGAGTERP